MGFGKDYRDAEFYRIIVLDSGKFIEMRDLTELWCGILGSLSRCGI